MPQEIQPLTEDDWNLYKVIATPAILAEFVYSTPEEPFTLWPKQVIEVNREALRKKRIQGRNLGKTATSAMEVVSPALMWSGASSGLAMIGVRAEINLYPVFQDHLVPAFERNPLLNMFLVPGDRGIDRKHFEIRLLNNVIIRGRIQGKDEQGFQTVHPNIYLWLDEVQLLSDAAVKEIAGMISGNVPVLASGVPNGVRGSFAHRIDTDPMSVFVGGKITRLDDPRETPETLDQLKRDLGGETSSAYLHTVLGMWGEDSRMTFDIDRIEHDLPLEDGRLRKAPAYYRSYRVYDREYSQDQLHTYFSIREDIPKSVTDILIHADHGITESPTTGYVSFYDSHTSCWRQYMRFLLFGMQAMNQAEILYYLSTEIQKVSGIKPVIGMDATGHGGQSVLSLLEPMGADVLYIHLGKNVVSGNRLETEEEVRARLIRQPFSGETRRMIPVEGPVKQVAMERLQKDFYSGEIRLVEQEELWKQVEFTTDHESANGRGRVYVTDYNPGDQPNYDHDLQAFQIFAAMRHQQELNAKQDEVKKFELWSEEIDIGWGGEDIEQQGYIPTGWNDFR